jgi:hypothetical protein
MESDALTDGMGEESADRTSRGARPLKQTFSASLCS